MSGIVLLGVKMSRKGRDSEAGMLLPKSRYETAGGSEKEQGEKRFLKEGSTCLRSD